MTDTTMSLREMCLFISRYGSYLLASGATCIRLENNIRRIVGRYGMKVETTVLLRHLHVYVTDGNTGDMITSIETVPNTGINFARNTELSRLSWEIADKKIGFKDAERKLNEIIATKPSGEWAILFLVPFANASFCRLFGGDVTAMIVVWIATFAGYYVKTLLLRRKCDMRITFIVCAFVSSIFGTSDMLFSLGTTPEVAIGTSILYLVPGVPFINSFSDLLYRHYLCAFSRFLDAMVLTCCLSLGLCAGMALMKASMF